MHTVLKLHSLSKNSIWNPFFALLIPRFVSCFCRFEIGQVQFSTLFFPKYLIKQQEWIMHPGSTWHLCLLTGLLLRCHLLNIRLCVLISLIYICYFLYLKVFPNTSDKQKDSNTQVYFKAWISRNSPSFLNDH